MLKKFDVLVGFYQVFITSVIKILNKPVFGV